MRNREGLAQALLAHGAFGGWQHASATDFRWSRSAFRLGRLWAAGTAVLLAVGPACSCGAGTQLLRNGELEAGRTAVTAWRLRAAAPSRALRVQPGFRSPSCVLLDCRGENWPELYQDMQLEQGREYFLSLRYRVSNPNPHTFVLIEFALGDPQRLYLRTMNTQWTPFLARFTATSPQARLRLVDGENGV